MINNAGKYTSLRWALFVVGGIIAFSSISALEEFGDSESSSRVLIAYETSRFKNKLFDELINELEDETYLHAVGHLRGELEEIESSDYDAVVIINAGVNSRVRPRVSAWLNEVEDTERIILLTTYRDLGWTPKYPDGVDSITSPSKIPEVEKLAATIVEKVQELIN